MPYVAGYLTRKFICTGCGKLVETGVKSSDWGYTVQGKPFCSYSCMRKFERGASVE